MNEETIFAQALEKISEEERTAYLDQACGDNLPSSIGPTPATRNLMIKQLEISPGKTPSSSVDG